MNCTFQIRCNLLAYLSIAALSFSGCGEMKVAPVTGTVTLDGAPLPHSSVMFLPKAGGRPSYGFTDEQGKYTLDYSLEEAGAEVGACTVKVSTAVEVDESDAKTAKEKVPAKYFKDAPIEVQVESKSNTIDIELTSK